MTSIIIRNLQHQDCQTIADAFTAQGWNKPAAQYERYLHLQTRRERRILIAFAGDAFCGYITVNYKPDYKPFAEEDIPEIADLNVLKKFQRRGIAQKLMQEAEALIKGKSKIAGLGVGLTADYGPAQQLYYQRGYAPDGRGITYKTKPVAYGDPVTVDDDLVLWMTKTL